MELCLAGRCTLGRGVPVGEGEPAWVGFYHRSASCNRNNYGLKQMLGVMPFILVSGGMQVLGSSHCD